MILGGFDMSEVSMKAFSRESMFDKRWHLRRERLVVYTIANLIVMAAGFAADYCMFKYKFLQQHVEAFSLSMSPPPLPHASLHNNDIIAAGILTIVMSCLVGLPINAEYFMLLFWPRRRYGRRYNLWKKWLVVALTAGIVGDAIFSTVVVVKNSAFITGVDSTTQAQLTALYFRPPLNYSSWAQNLAWIVMLWIGAVFTILSAILCIRATAYEERMPHGSGSPEERMSEAETEKSSAVDVTEIVVPAEKKEVI